MAILSRIKQFVFGSTGSVSNFGKIGSAVAGTPVNTKDLTQIQSLSQFSDGLSAITSENEPYLEDMNSLYYLITSQLAYVFQSGIPEYESGTAYYANISFCTYQGILYKSLTGTSISPNVGNLPPTSTNNWGPITTVYFNSLANLRNYTNPVQNGFTARVLGYYTPGDGGGGPDRIFISGMAPGTFVDNGGSITVPTGGDGSAAWIFVSAYSNPDWFGAYGDGSRDDTAALKNCAIASTYMQGTLGKTYAYNSISPAISSGLISIRNLKIQLFGPSRFIETHAAAGLEIINLTVDGYRGNFTELWGKQGSFNSIDTCYPIGDTAHNDLAFHFISNGTTDWTWQSTNVRVEDCHFTNMHNFACVTIFAGDASNVVCRNNYFSNCSLQEIYTTFSTSSVGTAVYENMTSLQCGILPATFHYYNGTTTTTVNFGDAGMPMPQGAFGFHVYGGNAVFNNLVVHDYGSCAITAEHCNRAVITNCNVTCDNSRAVSNNPSGAVWDEFNTDLLISNVQVSITTRSSLDVVGKSIMLLSSLSTGTKKILNNVKLSSTFALTYSLVCSSQGNTSWTFDKVTISDTTSANGFLHQYIGTASVKDTFSFLSGSSNAKTFQYAPCTSVLLKDSTLILTASNTMDTISGVAGITDNITPELNIDNTEITSSGGYFNIAKSKNILRMRGAKFKTAFRTNLDSGETLNMVTITGDSKFHDASGAGNGACMLYKAKWVEVIGANCYGKLHVIDALYTRLIGNHIRSPDSDYVCKINQTQLGSICTGNVFELDAGVVGGGYLFVNATPGNLVNANNQNCQSDTSNTNRPFYWPYNT